MKSHLIGPALCGLFALVSFSPGAADASEAAKPSPVTEAELRQSIAVLASDDFGGRAPGTPGETKTLTYIADAFWKAGLTGGGDGASGWFAPVALVETAAASSALSLAAPGGRPVLVMGKPSLGTKDGIVFYDRAPSSDVAFDGIVRLSSGELPDGVDIANKLVVLNAGNDLSETIAGIAGLAQHKPAAVLVAVADRASFDRVQKGFGRSRTTLAAQDGETATGVMGFVIPETLQAILKAAGVSDIGVVRPANGKIATRNAERAYTSYNVIAKLAGRDPQAGAVMFTGHWDHLGICRPEGAPDRICNGAVDNASGIAVLIAVAKRLAKMGPFERDIYFVATTSEEKGLLGAYAMAASPPVPLDRIVAAFNIDTIAIARRHSKVAIIGRGQTDLDPIIDHVARTLGRSIDSSDEANSFIRRQDGWALAQRGVPALMVGGSFSDMKLLEAFLTGDYHGPGDELTDATPLDGAAEDADLHVALGAYFADADVYEPKAKD